jgi:hypothetical protein
MSEESKAQQHRLAHLRTYDEEHPEWWKNLQIRQVAERRTVLVARVVESLSRGQDFKPDWTPFQPTDRDTEVLESMSKRGFDPENSRPSPISLLKSDEEYFVDDGRHRIFAAHICGIKTVEAEVYELEPISKQSQSKPRRRKHKRLVPSPINLRELSEKIRRKEPRDK